MSDEYEGNYSDDSQDSDYDFSEEETAITDLSEEIFEPFPQENVNWQKVLKYTNAIKKNMAPSVSIDPRTIFLQPNFSLNTTRVFLSHFFS